MGGAEGRGKCGRGRGEGAKKEVETHVATYRINPKNGLLHKLHHSQAENRF